jgi:response regulator of citrate/malate metabolism
MTTTIIARSWICQRFSNTIQTTFRQAVRKEVNLLQEIRMPDQQKQEPEKKKVPGFPDQTLEQVKEEIRKQYPDLTDEEIENYLSSSKGRPLMRFAGRLTRQISMH